jgi:translation initiation factor IF-1
MTGAGEGKLPGSDELRMSGERRIEIRSGDAVIIHPSPLL